MLFSIRSEIDLESRANKFFSRHLLIQFTVAVCDREHNGICHFGNMLAVLSLEAVFNQPLPYKFLGKLLLCFSVLLTVFISFFVEIP